MFVERHHAKNKGALWGTQEEGCWCSWSWKGLQNHLERVWTPPFHSQTDCVQMEDIQDHCYTPQEWSTHKDHPRARCVVHMIIKDPRVTPLPCWQMFRFIKLLKGEHQTAKLCVAGRGADDCIMVWALLAASRPRCLFITDGTMTSELFQQILKENQDICLRRKSRERKWVVQQYDDLHH